MGIDTLAARDAVLAVLRGIPALEGRVHDGEVPDDIDADDWGHVLPYVVLFTGVGRDLAEERDLSRLPTAEVADLTFQTQCVGPSSGHALAAALDVRVHLISLPLGRGWLQPDDRALGALSPIRDTNVTPARWFMPLRWRLVST